MAKAMKVTDKAAAAEIGKRRRPTATEWALNVVARQRGSLVAELFTAADELRVALVSGDREATRDAQRQERSKLDEVLRAATEVLKANDQSVGATNDQRLRNTLQAAVVDDELGELLRTGRLDRDFDAPGFGFGSGFGTDASASDTKPAAKIKQAPKPAANGTTTADDADATAEADRRKREEAEAAETAQRLWLEAKARHDQLVERAAELEAAAEELAVAAGEAARKAEQARRDADAAVERARTAREEAASAAPGDRPHR